MKKRLIALAILVAVGCMLLALFVPLLGPDYSPGIEVAFLGDSSDAATKRLLAVFETQNIPFTLKPDAGVHIYVKPKYVEKARTALVQEQQKGLKVTIK